MNFLKVWVISVILVMSSSVFCQAITTISDGEQGQQPTDDFQKHTFVGMEFPTTIVSNVQDIFHVESVEYPPVSGNPVYLTKDNEKWIDILNKFENFIRFNVSTKNRGCIYADLECCTLTIWATNSEAINETLQEYQDERPNVILKNTDHTEEQLKDICNEIRLLPVIQQNLEEVKTIRLEPKTNRISVQLHNSIQSIITEIGNEEYSKYVDIWIVTEQPSY